MKERMKYGSNQRQWYVWRFRPCRIRKGEDVKIIDIHEVSVLADYFIIASGTNPNQVQAMADNVEETPGKSRLCIQTGRRLRFC